jgi:dihydrolipoamide dehydrogenase
MSALEFDVIFIGAGPGGYVGAIRAAQLGFKTAVVEKGATFGGTCLNVGCIPSKALLESSELFVQAQKDFTTHGIVLESVQLNLKQMQSRKEKIVKDLTEGIRYLFKKNKIESFQGHGELLSANQVRVVGIKGSDTVELRARKGIILATGSVPNLLPGFSVDEESVVTSTGALAFSSVPQHLVVVGGGVIGLELGSVWSRLGAKVTVVEYGDQICSFLDLEILKYFRRSLEKQGLNFVTGAEVLGLSRGGSLGQVLNYRYRKTGAEERIECDKVLLSTGRKPFSEGLGLESLGIKKDSRGFVEVDAHFQTSVKGVYAIGDLIPGPMLAHKAEEEGVAVAEILAGQAGHVNYALCPSVIYTFPEVASVGLTEEDAKAKGLAYRVGTFPFAANGRARALGVTEGLVKIIAEEKTDRILGGHIFGPRGSELLGEIIVAMEFGGSSEDLARSFHSHPTLNEVVREAALGVEKRVRQM